MTDWTIDRVKDRLELAAEVMRQAPGVKPQGYFSAWPEYFHSFADKVGQKPRMRRPLPSPRMITEPNAGDVRKARTVRARRSMKSGSEKPGSRRELKLAA